MDAAWRMALLSELLLLALAGVGALLLGASPGHRLGLERGRLGWGRTLGVSAGLLCLSAAADAVLRGAGLRETGHLAELDRMIRTSPDGLALTLATLAVLPAVAEELLFRGLIQGALIGWLGPLPAVIATAALFGTLHGDPAHAGSAFVLGLYLGVVMWTARSVWPAMLAHAINNTLGVLTASGHLPVTGWAGIGPAALWGGLSAALLTASCWSCWRGASPKGTALQRGRDPADV